MEVQRHELKFFISEMEYQVLSRKLRLLLPLDGHVKNGNGYFIRSLYFDTPENKAFWEKQTGVLFRKKYRLRIYGLDDQQAKFEIKHKRNNQILKETAIISRRDALQVLEGNYAILLSYNDKILRQIYSAFQREKYGPVVIIDYIREPYVLPFNNIRITFDRFLRSNDSSSNIFKKGLFMRPLLKPGVVILEIKYDGFIPDWIKKALQISHFERCSIGKYFDGRLEPHLVYKGL